jgi:hypothetical protein
MITLLLHLFRFLPVVFSYHQLASRIWSTPALRCGLRKF